MGSEKEEGQEHIASDNRSRYENDELQLDGARKDCPGQGWMENAGERLMLLHKEQQA
ncbi:unnamed protein product [Schistosoma mattheei]|uniref:Uncharacterized protein n=1 Tax=Schistosoma mattheei TaxID=31246 RepID=A0A183Q6P3_9TREM|nr:unnamed protein product [Schistosoma mattheei]